MVARSRAGIETDLNEFMAASDFASTRRVLNGDLSRYTLLVIPAATYEHADVYEQVLAYARAGGAVFLTQLAYHRAGSLPLLFGGGSGPRYTDGAKARAPTARSSRPTC